MQWAEQGVRPGRYTVVPRTLSFILHDEALLLLRGAAGKRLGAGKLNGVGGHVEAGEDLLASAHREVEEETGLREVTLALRAVLHVAGPQGAPGVFLFVFLGASVTRAVRASAEGELAWYARASLPWAEMVDDLPLLLPRLLAPAAPGGLVYGYYHPDETGRLVVRFS
jgi:8-oxo-dGTP diphosphatase